MEDIKLNTIEEAIADFKEGKFVITSYSIHYTKLYDHTLLFIILYNGSNFFTCFNNLINILLQTNSESPYPEIEE